MQASDRVDLPSGDPAWSVLIWRQDSMTLARIRPILERLVALADEPCQVYAPDDCITQGAEPLCLSCRLKALRSSMYRRSGL